MRAATAPHPTAPADPPGPSASPRALIRLAAGLTAVSHAAESARLRRCLKVALDERDEARRDIRPVVARVTQLESELAAARQELASACRVTSPGDDRHTVAA